MPTTTPYRLLTSDYVTTFTAGGREFLEVDPEALTLVTRTAMHEIAHLLRPGHLAQLASILDDPEASPNDRFVALELLKNACIAAGGVLPSCQDTGTALVKGKKGELVLTGGSDREAIARGIFRTYADDNLRYSQLAPLDTYTEKNTGTNLPAEIEIEAVAGDAYKLLFMAKGGGSANKSLLFQETKALLNPDSLMLWLDEKLRTLGTAACPPYHLALVIGGTSAEFALKTAKLASARYLDTLPRDGNELGRGFRDVELEQQVLGLTQRVRDRRAVRREVLLPRRARDPAAASRRVVSGRARGRPARPTGRRSGRSPPTACSSNSSRPIRPSTSPTSPRTSSRAAPRSRSTSTSRWTRSDARCRSIRCGPASCSPADRRGRARHRARQDQGTARRRRRAAAVPPRLLRLLRGARQDAGGLRVRLVRSDHCRPHGFLRRPVPGRTAARW